MMRPVKAVFKGADAYKEMFKDSQCLLLISVGQESHEKERFEATINLINVSFKACIISLYDSLQRYTMALNSKNEPDGFHENAVKEGDRWLERNEKYFSKLTIPKKIVRWDMWLNHPNFLVAQDKIQSLINNDQSYRSVFEKTIDAYLDKYCKRINDVSDFDSNRAKQLCLDYIVEECAVLCLWPELECQFDIYPNQHNDAIEETRRRFIRPYYTNLLHGVTIRFRNARQIKPQYFEHLENKEEIITA